MDWEAAFAPYDEDTYRFVIERIGPPDVVLDIGAGDLRLARRLATIAKRVYAIERNATVLSHADPPTSPSPGSSDLGQHFIQHHTLAHAHVQLRDNARARRVNLILHLHRLQHH